MKKLIGGAVFAALVATTAVAQRDERIGAECRKEIVALCAADGQRERGAIRTCLMEKASQLSEGCRTKLKKRIEERRKGRVAPAANGSEQSYGADPKQKLDFYPASSPKAPLVVFIHGGGWSIGDKAYGGGAKPVFYNGQGYAFASLNYRLVPQTDPEGQTEDVARAIAWLRANAGRLGFDPDRIVLMGHSAGAHLAALVSTDTRLLDQAGVPPNAIEATILLDGAGYDVAAQMAYKGNRVQGMYDAAFGKDPARQKALSPIAHAAAPNVRTWQIYHVATREDSKAQSEALAAALTKAGATVTVIAVPGSTHMTVNRDAGQSGTFVGDGIAAFLKTLA